MTVRKTNLKRTQSEYAKELEKLNKLKTEVVKSIQGESAFSQSMLAGLVEDSEKKCGSLKAQCEKAESEVESSKNLNYVYIHLNSFKLAELYTFYFIKHISDIPVKANRLHGDFFGTICFAVIQAGVGRLIIRQGHLPKWIFDDNRRI